ncbi:MAG: hypothetical protein CL834_04975 [Crocinitomicaceae bacterium]|nr:hypothetical protein [Crocinitomicaceae bacterium]
MVNDHGKKRDVSDGWASTSMESKIVLHELSTAQHEDIVSQARVDRSMRFLLIDRCLRFIRP